MKKIGRNDPCHCGSGKKFKKCCESKMIGGRFMATKVETGPAKMSGLTGFFQSRVAEIIRPSGEEKPINATGVPPKSEDKPLEKS